MYIEHSDLLYRSPLDMIVCYSPESTFYRDTDCRCGYRHLMGYRESRLPVILHVPLDRASIDDFRPTGQC